MGRGRYTFKGYSSPNNFGPYAVDENRKNPIQAANGIQTQDATGTPVTSPVNVAGNAITTINVPTNAAMMHLIPHTNSVNFSEMSDMSTYATAPADSDRAIPCARMSVIYLEANTGTATGTTFWFEMV